MSEAIGPISVLPPPGQEQLLVPGANGGPSGATRQLIESEARRIVDECYARSIEELCDNRNRLDRLAAALLEHETLDQADAYRIAGIDPTGEPDGEPKEAAVGSALRDSEGSRVPNRHTGG
jgi:cell division protease FtsH